MDTLQARQDLQTVWHLSFGLDKQDMSVIMISSPAKPPKPSRAYLHLTKEEYINSLADKIRQTSFYDTKGSVKDSALLGPPSIEFAPHGRIPATKGRKDLRQGTIDQDQEFIDFLEGLTNPVIKPASIDQANDSAGKIKEQVVVTPLVQFLKDKKANKGKDAVAALKGAKHVRHDSKEGKTTPAIDKRLISKPSNPIASPEKRSAQAIKIEKAARDAVRVINKQPPTVNKDVVPPAAVTAKSPSSTSTSKAPLAEKKRERGNASAAAKILQRDLAIGANASGRGGKRVTPAKPATIASNPILSRQSPLQTQSSTEPAASVIPTSKGQDKETPVTPLSVLPNGSKPPNTPQPPKGPATSKASTKALTPETNVSNPGSVASNAKNIVSPTATQAFLKHANPSQGITEPLLEQAFMKFGPVKKVEIDKKKGFAYIDFSEPTGLQEAIKASPVKIAQGQVVVLERKTGPNLQARNARGGSHTISARGGGTPVGPRGARGGNRRGGSGRVGAVISNQNTAKPSVMSNSSGHANTAEDASTSPATTTSSAKETTETTMETSSATTSVPSAAQIEDKAPSSPQDS